MLESGCDPRHHRLAQGLGKPERFCSTLQRFAGPHPAMQGERRVRQAGTRVSVQGRDRPRSPAQSEPPVSFNGLERPRGVHGQGQPP